MNLKPEAGACFQSLYSYLFIFIFTYGAWKVLKDIFSNRHSYSFLFTLLEWIKHMSYNMYSEL